METPELFPHQTVRTVKKAAITSETPFLQNPQVFSLLLEHAPEDTELVLQQSTLNGVLVSQRLTTSFIDCENPITCIVETESTVNDALYYWQITYVEVPIWDLQTNAPSIERIIFDRQYKTLPLPQGYEFSGVGASVS